MNKNLMFVCAKSHNFFLPFALKFRHFQVLLLRGESLQLYIIINRQRQRVGR